MHGFFVAGRFLGVYFLLHLSLTTGAVEPARSSQDDLLTTAERSDYKATANHEEVMKFCRALAQSTNGVTLLEFGRSEEGRSLPLLVLSDAGVNAAPVAGGQLPKPAILVVATIHGGEVCGKEALLMLAREIGADKQHPLLRDFTLLFVPLLNADGNERMAPGNRPGQIGPEHGMGERENARGLDLNRDFVKLEAAETRALVRVLRQWDPIMVIDTHTTDGSRHRYTLTYDGPRHPATDRAISTFVYNVFLPQAAVRLKESTGYDSYLYGNFDRDHTRWETYPALPRYGAHYLGLRDRIAILSEAYSLAPFKDRVVATLGFVRACVETAATNKAALLRLLEQRRDDPPQHLALRAVLTNQPANVSVRGYLEPAEGAEPGPRDYDVQLWTANHLLRDTALPAAYLLPAQFRRVLTNLQQHGISVQELREDIDLAVDEYALTEIRRAENARHGHRSVQLSVTRTNHLRRINAGTLVIPTRQKLGKLAAYLLEPEAEDGLTAWNFFDDALKEGGTFPVLRLPQVVPLLTTAARPLPEDRTFKRRMTFEAFRQRPNFSGAPTRIERWLPGDRQFLQVRDNRLVKIDAVTGEVQPFVDPAKLLPALTNIAGIDRKTAENISKQTRFDPMNPQATAAVVSIRDDLYHLPFDGSAVVRLTDREGTEELPAFSPDGRWVAFVRKDNLYVVDVATQTERALTTDGGGDVRNGKADWVYFEEIYNRKWHAFWWSPDSTRLAFQRFDDSGLPLFHALDSIPLHGRTEQMRHPKAGDPNPVVGLGVVNVNGGPITWADLSDYTPASALLVRVEWLPAGDKLYFYMQDRAQTWLDFLLWDPAGLQAKRLFRETTRAWVDDLGPAYFVDDSSLIVLSDRSGWKHLYRYDIPGQSWRALTSGQWEVRRVQAFNRDTGWIYFTGTRDSALAENLYRCRLEGTNLERLTPGPGHHRVSLSPGGDYFAAWESTVHQPEHAHLRDGAGNSVRTLDSNPVYLREEFELAPAELLAVPTRDGFQMSAVLTEPLGRRNDERYPVWIMTYAGPKAPSVRNSWESRRLYEQMLAELGIIALAIDPRSASGVSSESAWTAYRQLGVQELADLSDAVAWLKSKPYVDGARIGMSGFSYGGFMTSYALTHSDLFAAGIAGGAVTDWRYYDSIYTERYMDLPQNNPDGYERTSVVKAAGKLHGRLLLVHGMLDDNVHLQNATALVDALQKAGKPFELMFYPRARHGISGRHYEELTIDFIRRSLGIRESTLPE